MEGGKTGGDTLRLEVGRIGNVLTHTLHGVMTLQNFLDTVTPVVEKEPYSPGPRLWDFRGTDPGVTSTALFVMGTVVRDRNPDPSSVAAYVANPGVQFMKFETYRRARSDENHIRKVFTTVEDALEWLERQELPSATAHRQRTPNVHNPKE